MELLINRTVKYDMTHDHLSNLFSALADPTRRAILASLTRGETSVQELARPFDMTLPAVSRHLKVLETAGLIERSRDAQYRPCRLKPERLRDVDRWLERYRQFWEASFDRLDEYLKEIQQADESKSTTRKSKSRASRKNPKGGRNARKTPRRK